jgi:hypothetical protein
LGLREVNRELNYFGKSLTDYRLPSYENTILDHSYCQIFDSLFESSTAISDSCSLEALLNTLESLNDDQRHIFDSFCIPLNINLREINLPSSSNQNIGGGIFFIDGPGGTGKTYLFNFMIDVLIYLKLKYTAVASSGIASLLLKNGRTAHSVFGIPLNIDINSVSTIRPLSDQAKIIKESVCISFLG